MLPLMNKIIPTLLLVVLCMGISQAQSKPLDQLQLKSFELPKGSELFNELKFQSSQAKLFYEKPELHEEQLGKLLDKRFQTISYKGETGSILYFEFDKDITNAKIFLETLMWEANHPSATHPEAVIRRGHTLLILSFPYKSEVGKHVTRLIRKK